MLREDFKDDIFAGARKYQIVKNSDGTVSFIDVTEYTQEGDAIGAVEFNQIGQEVNGKVEKIAGKGLSTNDYTTDEKNKLKNIAAGAEVNVQSDWNTTDTSSDAYIKNKPISMKNPAALTFTGGADGSYDGSTAKSVAIPTSLPASNTTSDYSAEGTAPVNGIAVNKALQTLDVAYKGGAGKYIQSISETDGKISAVEAAMPAIPAAVRVKGDAETTYHTGDVNLTPANIGAAPSSHTHAASNISAGTLGGAVVANASAVATLGTKQVRNIYAGTAALTDGSSALPTGDIYIQYE